MNLEVHEDVDARSIFAYMIPLSATTGQVEKYFKDAGCPVNKLSIMPSRGYWYGCVEFADSKSMQIAVELTNVTPLLNQMVKALPVKAEKNLVASTDPRSDKEVAKRFYISRLTREVTEAQLKELFGRFGLLDFVRIEPQTAIVQFADFMLVEKIVKGRLKMNNKDIMVSNVENGTANAIIQYNRRTFGISEPHLADHYKEANGFVVKEFEDASYFKNSKIWVPVDCLNPPPQVGVWIIRIDASCCWPNQFGYGATVTNWLGEVCWVIFGNKVDTTKCTQYQETFTVWRVLDKINATQFHHILIKCDNESVSKMLYDGIPTGGDPRLGELMNKIKVLRQSKYYTNSRSIDYEWDRREKNFTGDHVSRKGLYLLPNKEFESPVPDIDWTTTEILRRERVGGIMMDIRSRNHRSNQGTSQGTKQVDAIPLDATRFLVIKNLCAPASVVSELDKMKAYVLTKCSEYGKVQSAYFDNAGDLFLKFEKVEDAAKFKKVMDYRWVYSRMLRAFYCSPDRALWALNPGLLDLLKMDRCKAVDPTTFEERLHEHVSIHIRQRWGDTVKESMHSRVAHTVQAPSRQQLIEDAKEEFAEKITEEYKELMWPTPAESSQKRDPPYA